MKTNNKKSVIVIGGGPSTLDVDRWFDLQTDEVVTVSNAYRNKHVQKTKTDYHFISAFTDFSCEDFAIWHKNSLECKFVREPFHLAGRTPKGINDFDFKHPIIDFNFNDGFRLGIVARVIIWLINSGDYSNIYFVGFDGYTPQGLSYHAFANMDFILGQVNDAGRMVYGSYLRYYNDFEKFYNHVKTLTKNTDIRLHNLGHGHEANILTRIHNDIEL